MKVFPKASTNTRQGRLPGTSPGFEAFKAKRKSMGLYRKAKGK